ncbi:hypothetical protein RJ640_029397 [Escallonia rubra]|uniref:Stress induced protein n=1 Tax=Escallonia rubra TaxID=112253 RepID=A0AA88RRY1_9ASTE|nr:hypothetical protein RJ640_029397 [Escallonia rubra]
MMSHSSPILEEEAEGRNMGGTGHFQEDEAVSGGGCGCFRLFCFEFGHRDGERKGLLQGEGEQKEAWLVRKLKTLKVFSELVAGPKWKNFIRKFGKNRNGNKARARYQYDPQSYALNFEDSGDEEEEEGVLLGFSSRFAPPFSSEQPRS